MKILITGNMGYVGPRVVASLREFYHGCEIVGLDSGYFAHCLSSRKLPEVHVDKQLFADVRDIDSAYLLRNGLEDVDAVVYLSAISNDVLGEMNPELTDEINCRSAVRLARMVRQNAEANGKAVRFVFASSTSVYGDGSGGGGRLRVSPAC